MKRNLLFLITILLLSACAKYEPENPPAGNDDFAQTNAREGIIRIKLKQQAASIVSLRSDTGAISTGLADLDAIARQLGAKRIEPSFADIEGQEWKAREAGLDRWYDIYFDESVAVTRAWEELETLGEIEVVEPDYVIEMVGDFDYTFVDQDAISGTRANQARASMLPFDDPMLGGQWNYYNDGTLSGSIVGADINLFDAWQVSAGSPEVIVAVVDGGIDCEHIDLNANMWKNSRGECGWNFVDNTARIVPHNHGTHVAGTIAAVNNNGYGVSGIAGGSGFGDGVRLMSCQVYKPDPRDSNKDIASSRIHEAIRFGADNGAVISQNSWGYEWKDRTQPPPSLLQIHRDAIDYFIRYAGTDSRGEQSGPMKGGIVIFAAGNDNTSYKSYPPAYEKVVSVAAFGPDLKKSYYSNYGNWITVSAPGGDKSKGLGGEAYGVLSTATDDRYAYAQGTSMACPHVSGVAALLVSVYGGPGFTAERLRTMIVGACNNIDNYQLSNYRGLMGAGGIDASLALRQTGGIPPEKVTALSAIWTSNSAKLSWAVTSDADNVKAYKYIVYASKTPLRSDNDLKDLRPAVVAFVGTKDVGDGLEATVGKLDQSTDYYMAIVACDRFGNRSDALFERGTTLRNYPPVMTPESSAKMVVKAHETKTYGFRVVDPENHAWSVSVDALYYSSLLQEGVTVVKDNTDAGKFYLKINGYDLWKGSFDAEITVTDEFGAKSVESYNFTVLRNNSPEYYGSLDDVYSNNLGGVVRLSLGDYFRDADGETMRYEITSDLPGMLRTQVDDQGVADIQIVKTGKSTVRITAYDYFGESASGTFILYSRDGSQPVEIFPNPVVDKINFRVGPGDDQTIGVSIYSSAGVKVVDTYVSVVAYEAVPLDLSGLRPGNYMMKVTTKGTTIERKIIKI